MRIMSLQVFEKQYPVSRGDCFATCARNDMPTASLRALQSQTQEELRLFFGRALLPSVLDRAFKGELIIGIIKASPLVEIQRFVRVGAFNH